MRVHCTYQGGVRNCKFVVPPLPPEISGFWWISEAARGLPGRSLSVGIRGLYTKLLNDGTMDVIVSMGDCYLDDKRPDASSSTAR